MLGSVVVWDCLTPESRSNTSFTFRVNTNRWHRKFSESQTHIFVGSSRVLYKVVLVSFTITSSQTPHDLSVTRRSVVGLVVHIFLLASGNVTWIHLACVHVNQYLNVHHQLVGGSSVVWVSFLCCAGLYTCDALLIVKSKSSHVLPFNVAGTGQIAGQFAGDLTEHTSSQLVAVLSRSKDRATAFGSKVNQFTYN